MSRKFENRIRILIKMKMQHIMFNVDAEDKQLELVTTTSVTAKKQKQYKILNVLNVLTTGYFNKEVSRS